MSQDIWSWRTKLQKWRHPDPLKAAWIAERRRELKRVVPILLSMPWGVIKAGHKKVRDMSRFLDRYEMYAAVLAKHESVLAAARDSDEFESFELHASAGHVTVTGVDRDGNRKVLVETSERYWGKKLGKEMKADRKIVRRVIP